MYHTGIADEAGKSIDVQIKAHRELGWKHIELRGVNGVTFTDVSDAEFEQIRGKLADNGLQCSCFASAIANWASKITDPFEKDIETLTRSIKRMQKMKTEFIRVMSWNNDGMSEDAWRDEAVRRMKKLADLARDGGVKLVIENCGGWASASAENFKRFFELVNSPALKAVYDTGNPASHLHNNTWDWYQAAKPHIVYVHIKAHTGPVADEKKRAHVYPDDPAGASLIRETLADIFKSGYDGGISIEPHLKSVVHEGKTANNEEAAYLTYVEYGKRTMKLVQEALKKAGKK